MKYITQKITDFTNTNLTDLYPVWNPATTYSFETNPTSASICRYGSWYYRSLISGNINQNPFALENVSWVKHSVSNKFAMLDFKAQTRSVYNGNMMVEFNQEGNQHLGIGYYSGKNIKVECILDEETIWTYESDSIRNLNIVDYWTYIYEPYTDFFSYSTFLTIPLLGDKIRITINAVDPAVTSTSCGFIVFGAGIDMGQTLSQVNFSYNSYAIKTYDDFGSMKIVKRAVQDVLGFETIIPREEIDMLRKNIKNVYNDIVMFVLDESESSDYENLITLGTIQDASIILNDNVKSIVSFTIVEAI
jgi:hypothetical protein